jgi:hypothetical protein
MPHQPVVDPLFDALAGLTPLAPRESHDRRVLRRCRALLADHRERHQAADRPVRFADAAIATAAAVYIAAIVAEAVRLLGAITG